MASGGYRAGAGRKPNPIKLRAEPKLKKPRMTLVVPAEPKPAFDYRAMMQMLPEIEEISRRYSTQQPRTRENNPFRLPEFPPGAIPKREELQMAQDSALTQSLSFSGDQWMSGPALDGLPGQGLMFLGYSYLAELAQRPEFRVMAETIADDATREWIDFDVVGDEKTQEEERAKDPQGYDERMADPDERKKRLQENGKTDKVKELKDDQLRLEVRDRFYDQSRGDGFFGRSHLMLDIWTSGQQPSAEELKSSIGDSRDATSKVKVPKGSFRGLKTIEPVWTYPLMYNALNPLQPDWYNPQVWYVMGNEIHGTRLQTFVGHPVPDMLKPAYAFGGLSLTQMAKPYVDIWLETRQSVARLIHSFSVMVLMTDTSTLMQPGTAGALIARVALFNMLRDNQSTYVVNKNTEDFKNVSASLSGLHELQAQAQEHMASVHRIPLVKFTGIQPSGLNASSEGEIQVYDDTIAAYQARLLDPNLRRVINFEHLSLWGEIDPEITHVWKPLREMTQAERGQKEKDDADRNQKYVDMGAIAPAEVRKAIIEDPDLPYTGLNPDDVPDLAAEEEAGLEPDGGRPDPKAVGEPDKGGGANDAADPFGASDEWNEADHPRGQPDNAGQFGSGGGAPSKPASSMPDIPDFLKKSKTDVASASPSKGQTLKMPQFGLSSVPWESHQPSAFKLPRRKPMPKSSGDPNGADGLVAFSPGEKSELKELNGVAFKSWHPPEDWAGVEGQAEIDEPALPRLPKGMTMSTGVVIREKDGRVWLMRPSGGFGGYDQTFPKGGLEDGLSGQANAIKEAWEETGLKVKITGFAGDHEGDTTVSRFYFAERVGGDPKDAGWEAEGVILAPADKLDGLLNRTRDKTIAASLSPAAKPKLDPKGLKKLGGKMGSNEGGTFEDKDGNKFYIKRPESKAHVANEMAAARLYQLAGVNTLNYREVEGGNHVATELEKLDKKNVSDLSPAERKAATNDFAVHAWLSNWDAAGTGGDNQGVLNGKVTTLDVGGSLKYRAQGEPKGSAFGDKVTELDTMRDPAKSHDAAKLFGKMSDADLKASVERVTSIPDEAIRKAVGGDTGLADRLIARKGDMAARFGVQAADADWKEGDHPRAPDGKFGSGGGSAEHDLSDPSLVAVPMSKQSPEVSKAVVALSIKKGFKPDVQVVPAAKLAKLRATQMELNAPGEETEGKGAPFPQYADKPIIVRENGTGILRIVDGHNRISSFVRSGKPVEAYVFEEADLDEDVLDNIRKKYPGAQDEALDGAAAAFEESKHPRDPDGKFASGGGGGAAFKSKKEHAAHLLSKGTTTQEMLKALGWPSISMPQMAKTLGMKLEKTKVNGVSQYKGVPMTAAEKMAEKGKEAMAQAAKIEAAKLAAAQTEKQGGLGAMGGQKAPPLVPPPEKGKTYGEWKAEQSVYKPQQTKPKHGPATEAELAKAKKTGVPLQMQYVPNGSSLQGNPEAQKLVEAFNKKWLPQTQLNPAQLQEKVDDFKDLNAAMVPLMNEAQKAHHVAVAKAAIAEKEKAAAEAAKIAEAMNDPSVKEHYDALKKIADPAAFAKQIPQLEKFIAQHKLDIKPADCAFIRAYVGSHYGPVNDQLRKGILSVEQWKYAAALDNALDRMPKYEGYVQRGASLNKTDFAKYANAVGKVTVEQQFTSAGVKQKLWGSSTFHIQSKSARDIRAFNPGEGGGEVVFKHNTKFLVTKVNEGSQEIWMEEI